MFFFLIATPTTNIYTLSLHDALPIFRARRALGRGWRGGRCCRGLRFDDRVRVAFGPERAQLRPEVLLRGARDDRSEEHTSELQSQSNLVCRLLLEKKKNRQSSARVLA